MSGAMRCALAPPEAAGRKRCGVRPCAGDIKRAGSASLLPSRAHAAAGPGPARLT